MSEQIIAARERPADWAKTAIQRLWANPYSDRQMEASAAQAAHVAAAG